MLKKYYCYILPIVSLIIGGLIYVGFRTSTLVMFKWFSILELHDLVDKYRLILSGNTIKLPEFVVFSLPNGLWAFSFISIIGLVLRNEKICCIVWMSIASVIILGAELLQYFSIISGQFDINDFSINCVSILLGFIYIEIVKNFRRVYVC